jgi:hypothetical protein
VVQQATGVGFGVSQVWVLPFLFDRGPLFLTSLSPVSSSSAWEAWKKLYGHTMDYPGVIYINVTKESLFSQNSFSW